MGKIVTGDVVVVTFPFSDLSKTKLRPAIVLARAEFDNVILCQITSRPYSSKKAIAIINDDFAKGGLAVVCYARPDKLFTAEPVIVRKVAGHLKKTTLVKILLQVQRLFRY